jgi:hypothetical protein
VDVDGAATTILRQTPSSGRTHRVDDKTATTRVTSSGSSLTLDSATVGAPRLVRSYRIYGQAASGTLLLTPTSSTAWRAQTTSGTTTVEFRVGGRSPGVSYRVLRDGVLLRRVTATSAGEVTFSDPVGTTSVSYAVAL